MKILLDTHVALWALVGSPRLSERSSALIQSQGNAILISSVVLWEISIKRSLNRGDTGDMPIDAPTAQRLFLEAGYEEHPIAWDDAVRTANLPPLHSDPFDRMLVAQTVGTDLWLLTNDAKILGYGGNILAN